MRDLTPLLGLILGCVAIFGVAWIIRNRQQAPRLWRAIVGVVLPTAVVMWLPYLAYHWFPGDPDVWDFYRAYRIVPMLVSFLAATVACLWILHPEGEPEGLEDARPQRSH